MGSFIGQRLSYLIVNAIKRRTCASKGLIDMLFMENGLFLFKFMSEEAVELILEEEPWHMVNRPVFLGDGSLTCLSLRRIWISCHYW